MSKLIAWTHLKPVTSTNITKQTLKPVSMLYFDLTKISGVTRQTCKHMSTYNEDGFSRSPDFHAPVWLSSVPWHCRTERAELSDGLQTRLDHFPHWTGAVGDSLMGHCLAQAGGHAWKLARPELATVGCRSSANDRGRTMRKSTVKRNWTRH